MKMNDAIIVLIAGLIFIVCVLFWLKAQMRKVNLRTAKRSKEWQEKIHTPFTDWLYPLFNQDLSDEHRMISFLLHRQVRESHKYYLADKEAPLDISNVLSQDEIKMMNKISPFTP